MSRGNGFTPQECEFIRECIANGWTSDYCAKKLGRSVSGVTAQASKMGLGWAHRVKFRTYSRKYG